MSAPAPPHLDGPAPDALVAALLASPHVLALLLDGAGRVARAGAGCERLTGRSPADANGRPAWECVFAARSGPEFRAAIARAAAGESAEVETECSAADGTRRRIVWSLSAIPGAGAGGCAWVLCTGLERATPPSPALDGGTPAVSRDVSERRRAEEDWRASEERYRALVENASDIIYETDLEGYFTYVNPTAERLMGYPVERLLGIRFTELVRPDRRDEVLAFYIRQLEEAILNTYLEFPAVSADGREVWIGQNVRLLHRDGVVSGVQAVARDITARHEVERMKDEFVGMVSHELRTPLTSIRGSLGALAAGALSGDQGRQMVRIAVRSTDRLIRMVNDILDLERLRTGRLVLRPAEVDVGQLLRHAADAVRGMAEQAGVLLEVAGDAAPVRGDADRLVQVLVNLLANAVKFSPPGSAVVLHAAEEEDGVAVSVSDVGRGIPPELHQVVFERFHQVDWADARLRGGTGLGLAICHHLVELHGGRITLRSAPGEGSTFTVHLPR